MSVAEDFAHDSRRFTFADTLKWEGEERFELYHGEPVAMSPAPGLTHQRLLARLSTAIGRHLWDGPCEVIQAPVAVVLGREATDAGDADVVLQPDLIVVCDSHKLTDRNAVVGPPDLVVEVLSPSTAARDMGEKFALYDRHGVKEYWIVNLWTRSVMVHRREGSPRLALCATVLQDGILGTPLLPGLAVAMTDLFKDLPEETGR